MTCDDVRQNLLDMQRGRLPADLDREVRLHLEGCPACTRARHAEEVLTDLLERRLPFHPAPSALKQRLAALANSPARAAPPAARARWARGVAPALAAAALVVAIAGTLVQRRASDSGALGALTAEAVNDHLRVLQREPLVEVGSSDMHQVKPWFEGKVDFAPSVPAPVVADMRLEGGSIGYFVDRKAAVVTYRLRRHLVTLLAFRADGLPGATAIADGRPPLHRSLRGFDVFLWRSGEIGYALVADVDPAELSAIAAKLAGHTRSAAGASGSP